MTVKLLSYQCPPLYDKPTTLYRISGARGRIKLPGAVLDSFAARRASTRDGASQSNREPVRFPYTALK